MRFKVRTTFGRSDFARIKNRANELGFSITEFIEKCAIYAAITEKYASPMLKYNGIPIIHLENLICCHNCQRYYDNGFNNKNGKCVKCDRLNHTEWYPCQSACADHKEGDRQ